MSLAKKRLNKNKKNKREPIVEDSSDSYATDDQLDDEDYSPEEDLIEDLIDIEKQSKMENKNTQQTSSAANPTQMENENPVASSSGRMKATDSDKLLEICLKEFTNIRSTSTGNPTGYQKQILDNQLAWQRIQAEFTTYFGVSITI